MFRFTDLNFILEFVCILCSASADKTEALAKTFFTKYLTKLRMNVKNMMFHY